MARVFIGIGSNIDPEVNVAEALRHLGRAVRITGVSTFYRTPALGPTDQPPFINGVVEIETDTPPEVLKDSVLREIESDLGRMRTEDKYAPRTIDLDILVYEGAADSDPEIAERAFLAIPLFELAPDLVLPGSGERIRDIEGLLAGRPMDRLLDYTERLREEMRRGPG